jgi:hypothetical protein
MRRRRSNAPLPRKATSTWCFSTARIRPSAPGILEVAFDQAATFQRASNASGDTDTEAGPLDDLLGHSITYRIAVGNSTKLSR